jgi:hypothetical protein
LSPFHAITIQSPSLSKDMRGSDRYIPSRIGHWRQT